MRLRADGLGTVIGRVTAGALLDRLEAKWVAAFANAVPIPAVLILICILSFAFRGFNYGVEFKGGSTFTFQYDGREFAMLGLYGLIE